MVIAIYNMHNSDITIDLHIHIYIYQIPPMLDLSPCFQLSALGIARHIKLCEIGLETRSTCHCTILAVTAEV